MKRKVRKVARQLGYAPNGSAIQWLVASPLGCNRYGITAEFVIHQHNALVAWRRKVRRFASLLRQLPEILAGIFLYTPMRSHLARNLLIKP